MCLIKMQSVLQFTNNVTGIWIPSFSLSFSRDGLDVSSLGKSVVRKCSAVRPFEHSMLNVVPYVECKFLCMYFGDCPLFPARTD